MPYISNFVALHVSAKGVKCPVSELVRDQRLQGSHCFFSATIAPSGAFAERAYRFVNDQVSVEAEDLGYSGSSWEKATAKSGYTGSGYMIYKGPEMAPPAPTQSNWETYPEKNNVAGQYQGSESTWLKVPVYIEDAGSYFINIRNQHEHNCFELWCYNDGDATVWTHVIDYPLPVRHNFGHSHTDNNSWMWMKFGPGLAQIFNPLRRFSGAQHQVW